MRLKCSGQNAVGPVLSFVMSTVLLCAAVAASGKDEPKVKAGEPAGVNPNVDTRVEKALNDAGYKYTVTPLGNFRITFKLDDGRGHWVFISSRTEKFNTLETRKIWATVMKSKDPLPAETANRLLMDNIPQKLGAFELTKVEEGGYKVQFAVRIDADMRAAKLKDVLRLVLVTADAKEKELTNADEF